MSLGSQLEAIYKVKTAYWIKRFTIANLRALMSFSIISPENDLMAFPSAVLSPYSQLSLFYNKNNMQALFFLCWRAEHVCKQGVLSNSANAFKQIANPLRASGMIGPQCNRWTWKTSKANTLEVNEWALSWSLKLHVCKIKMLNRSRLQEGTMGYERLFKFTSKC